MYAHNLRMHLVRALARPRLAAGVLVTLALLSTACSDSDPASSIIAPSLLSSSSNSQSAGPSVLGSASNFGVLGATTVTCTGASTVAGDVGVWPGSAITGFNPDCTLTGTLHFGDAVAKQAQADAAAHQRVQVDVPDLALVHAQ